MADPPAPDLGALRKRLLAKCPRTDEPEDLAYLSVWSDDLRAFIAAYDAQAARLAAAHEALALACVTLRSWPHGEPSATLAKCRAAFAMIDDAVKAGEP